VGGYTVSNVRDNVDIKLSDALLLNLQSAQLSTTRDSRSCLAVSIKFSHVTTKPGASARISPNSSFKFKQGKTRLPISSVVLSSQRVNTRDALYNTPEERNRSRMSKESIRAGRTEADPSVTRVFNTGREMYVFLQAYAGAPSSTASAPTLHRPFTALAIVSLLPGNRKAFESTPVSASPAAGSHLGLFRLVFRSPW